MSEDEHFNEPGPSPPLGVEDHQPTDKIAARSIAVVVAICLMLGGLITVLVYRQYSEPTGTEQEGGVPGE